MEYIKHWLDSPNFEFHKVDLRNKDEVLELCRDFDVVFHFAVNPEV